MAVASWAGRLLTWQRDLAALKDVVAQVFGRRELKQTSGDFLDGLLSGIARKTGWMLAEQAGDAKPYRMQSLLGRGRWEADALRDRVRDYAIAALGDPDGVLVAS
jgi:SRSO17 transposase